MTGLPRLMLDTGPLGKLANPSRTADTSAWIARVRGRYELMVPEVADYEVRREFIMAAMGRSVVRLDDLKAMLTYVPITTPAMLKAAELWADARRRGRPTADPKELDCDVVLAAQAVEAGATVVTENVGHLARYVPVSPWSTVFP